MCFYYLLFRVDGKGKGKGKGERKEKERKNQFQTFRVVIKNAKDAKIQKMDSS